MSPASHLSVLGNPNLATLEVPAPDAVGAAREIVDNPGLATDPAWAIADGIESIGGPVRIENHRP